ncbi:MAG TPA: hypothetical protein VGD52_09475, partial [Pseudoduganella sp.]
PANDSAEAAASFAFDRRSPIVAIRGHWRVIAPDAAGLRLILIYSDRTPKPMRAAAPPFLNPFYVRTANT